MQNGYPHSLRYSGELRHAKSIKYLPIMMGWLIGVKYGTHGDGCMLLIDKEFGGLLIRLKKYNPFPCQL